MMSGLVSVFIGAVIGAGIGSIVGVLIFKPKLERLQTKADGVKFIAKASEMKDKRLTKILENSLETYTDTLAKSQKKKPSVVIRLGDKNAKAILESATTRYVYVTGTVKKGENYVGYGYPGDYFKIKNIQKWLDTHSEKAFTKEKISRTYLLLMLEFFNYPIQGTAEAYCVSNPKFKLEVRDE